MAKVAPGGSAALVLVINNTKSNNVTGAIILLMLRVIHHRQKTDKSHYGAKVSNNASVAQLLAEIEMNWSLP